MPRDKNKFVYLIGLQGPLFKINLPPGKFCVIKNVIIVHSAQNSADKLAHININPETDLKKKANVKSCLFERSTAAIHGDALYTAAILLR